MYVGVDPDEQYDRYILYVLNKIKKELRRSEDDSNTIRYSVFLIPVIKDPFVPHPTEEQNLLRKLARQNLYEQIGEIDDFQIGLDARGQPEAAGITFTFQINIDLFNREHKKIKTKIANYDLKKDGKFAMEENKEAAQGFKLRLTIYQSNNEFIFQSSSGTQKKATFNPGTNEYSILKYFIDHLHQNFQSHDLLEFLVKGPRNQTNPEPKRRVKDAIKAIRDKLGKEIITTKKQFYSMDCEVLRT